MRVLYINACVREESRTDRLARKLLEHFPEYEELKLDQENLLPLDQMRLSKRTERIEKQEYSSEMFDYARVFSSADVIVISAPFWDLSFPALLKLFIENIYVTGMVSEYGPDGMPKGLCRAEKLYYVTTAGGPYDPRYSYDYIRDLALHYFGIKETTLIKAEMLDVIGFDPEQILQKAEEEIEQLM